MSPDLPTRLRRWTHAVDAVPASDLMDEAADEIERLRDELASATRHMELAEAAWLRETAGNSPAAVTLTDEEREAVKYFAATWPTVKPHAATLRGLLERMK